MTEDQHIKPFETTLRTLGQGRLSGIAAEELASLVRSVADAGKAGTYTLKFAVKPVPGSEDQVTVDVTTALRPPVLPVTNMFFTDEAGNLHRDDPQRAPAGDLREVPFSTGEARTV